MTYRLAALPLLLVALAACSSSSSTPSGEPEQDAAGPLAHDDASTGADATMGTPGPSVDAATPTDAATPAKSSTLTLTIPAGFSGATRQLDVVVSASLPIAGPPAAVLYQSTSAPAVTAGQPLEVPCDLTSVTGDYYIIAVLYMQGGGQFAPKSGVDYVAYGAQKVHFDGKQMDLGTMPMGLAGTDAGH